MGGLSPTIAFDRHQLVDGAPQLQVLLSQAAILHRAKDEMAELIRIDGLGEIVKRPILECPDRRLDGGEGGDDDHGGLRGEAMDVLLELQAVHPAQLDVQQGDVRTGAPPWP